MIDIQAPHSAVIAAIMSLRDGPKLLTDMSGHLANGALAASRHAGWVAYRGRHYLLTSAGQDYLRLLDAAPSSNETPRMDGEVSLDGALNARMALFAVSTLAIIGLLIGLSIWF